MNERLSLQDLIDLLAKKQEITKKDAETFLRELVAVISETIEKNEPVKIKDFGVFKLVKVNARKSVDVNTGEAIEIAAHYKLSFTPDKSLKEAINRPFAHFESVIIEEGVTFDNISVENAVDEDDISEKEEIIIQDNAEELIEFSPPVPVEEAKDEELTEVTEPVGHSELSVEEDKLSANNEGVTEAEDDDQQTEEKPDSPAFIHPAQDNHNIVNDDITEIGDTDIEAGEIKIKSSRKKIISLGFFIFLIIAGFFVGGLYFEQIATYLTYGEHDKPVKTAYLDEKQQAKEALIVPVDSTIIDGQKTDTIKLEETIIPENPPVVNEPLGTVTIQSGHTLRNISLQYYGHKSFWIYIYQENKGKIKNPNKVPIGTKLILPSPAKYGIDAKDTLSVNKAKEGESKLIRELGL